MGALRILSMVLLAAGIGLASAGLGRILVLRRAPLAELVEQDSWELYSGPSERATFADRLLTPARRRLGSVARKLTPRSMLSRMRRHAVLAGMGAGGVESILAQKVVATAAAAILLPAAALTLAPPVFHRPLLLGAVGAAAGFFAPDLWISRKGRARQEAIRRDLPETIDLMAISVQAGMGLEAAIELASQTLPGALGDELYRLLQEIQLGASRREALQQLRERTDIAELSSFALALIQADATGSPIADVLHSNSARMRMVRRQVAREKASKLPVKLLFPTLFFIFPALFVVIIGPAGIKIFDLFTKT